MYYVLLFVLLKSSSVIVSIIVGSITLLSIINTLLVVLLSFSLSEVSLLRFSTFDNHQSFIQISLIIKPIVILF